MPILHKERLAGVHPKLLKILDIWEAENKEMTITVSEGLRTVEKEIQYIASGASRLKDPKNCKHVIQADGFGHAVDLHVIENNTIIKKKYIVLSEMIKKIAKENNTLIVWGGDWIVNGKRFDEPHYQI